MAVKTGGQRVAVKTGGQRVVTAVVGGGRHGHGRAGGGPSPSSCRVHEDTVHGAGPGHGGLHPAAHRPFAGQVTTPLSPFFLDLRTLVAHPKEVGHAVLHGPVSEGI